MTPGEIRQRIASVPVWHHIMELAPGIVTPGRSNCQRLLELLCLPDTLTGKRVLDIGARDGFFSFEMERRGAEVLAMDYVAPNETGFSVAKEILGSKVEYLHENLYSLSADKIGKFDIVLFLGVLYHLRDPMLALDIIRSLCSKDLYVETLVISTDEVLSELPLMRFYPRDSVAGDYSTYWGPNAKCMVAMLEESRFQVLRSAENGSRGVFCCRVVEEAVLEYHARIARTRTIQGWPA